MRKLIVVVHCCPEGAFARRVSLPLFLLFLLSSRSTFSAIPLAFDLFASHKAMCGMQVLGIMANMTRKRWVHAAWCVLMLYLVKFRQDIEW
jgi:hypothetical protein